MIEDSIIIKKNKLIYILKQDSVVVGVGFNQWVSYDKYNNPNKNGITNFKNVILKSKLNEYDTATDQMSLAYNCKIRGVRVKKPKEIIE